jgi:hypothetical protein
MLLFYATYRRGRASIYGSAAAGGARAETASDNELHQSHEWNGNSMVSLRDGFKFEASSFKQEGRGAPRLRIGDCGLRIQRCRLRADAGGKMRKTNPIWPRRGRLTERIVRNEAKLGWTGVCGQRPSSRGPWLGRGVKRAKRTQFGLAWVRCRKRCAQSEAKPGRDGMSGQRLPPPLGAPAVGRNVQNKPNLRADHGSAKYLIDKMLRKICGDSASAKTKPIALWHDGRRVGGDCGR